MSEQAYLMARVSKSYINGAWTPITKIPKTRLKNAVAGGRFGQHHLADVDTLQNTVRNAAVDALRDRRSKAKVSGTVANIHGNKGGGGVMERIVGGKPGGMRGPHVNWANVPGERHQIALADNRTMRQVQPAISFSRMRGAKDTIRDRETVNAHEMAHAGRSSRPMASRASASVQRMMDKEKGSLALAVGLDRAGKNPTTRQTLRIAGAQQRMLIGSLKQNLGEEARADVVASRKLGRHAVSGHVLDTNDPKDYLRIRNKIERGMRVPKNQRTRMDQVMQ